LVKLTAHSIDLAIYGALKVNKYENMSVPAS